jgi:hypothetical protein
MTKRGRGTAVLLGVVEGLVVWATTALALRVVG